MDPIFSYQDLIFNYETSEPLDVVGGFKGEHHSGLGHCGGISRNERPFFAPDAGSHAMAEMTPALGRKSGIPHGCCHSAVNLIQGHSRLEQRKACVEGLVQSVVDFLSGTSGAA